MAGMRQPKRLIPPAGRAGHKAEAAEGGSETLGKLRPAAEYLLRERSAWGRLKNRFLKIWWKLRRRV